MSMKRNRRNLDPVMEDFLDRHQAGDVPLLYDQAVVSWEGNERDDRELFQKLSTAQHVPIETVVGQHFPVVHIAFVPIGEECTAGGCPVRGYRTVLFDKFGCTYFSDSPYVFASIRSLCDTYGMPPWNNGGKVLVDHRGMVRGTPMIVLIPETRP